MIVLYVILGVLGGILALFSFLVLFLYGAAFAVDTEKEYTKPDKFYHFLFLFWIRSSMWFMRVHVNVQGMELMPENTRFLLVGNHRSNFDPILAWMVLEKYDIAYISKPENFKIPAFGRVIRRCGFMAIDRKDARNAFMTIEKAVQRIRDNAFSIAIYPEGTRNKEAKGLLPFRNGAFKVAKMAGCPIVIMSMTGTELIHRQWLRKRTDIDMKILKVIPAEEVDRLRTHEIGDIVRAELLKGIGEDLSA